MEEKEATCPVCGEECIYCAEDDTCEECGEDLNGDAGPLCEVCQEEEEEE